MSSQQGHGQVKMFLKALNIKGNAVENIVKLITPHVGITCVCRIQRMQNII